MHIRFYVFLLSIAACTPSGPSSPQPNCNPDAGSTLSPRVVDLAGDEVPIVGELTRITVNLPTECANSAEEVAAEITDGSLAVIPSTVTPTLGGPSSSFEITFTPPKPGPYHLVVMRGSTLQVGFFVGVRRTPSMTREVQLPSDAVCEHLDLTTQGTVMCHGNKTLLLVHANGFQTRLDADAASAHENTLWVLKNSALTRYQDEGNKLTTTLGPYALVPPPVGNAFLAASAEGVWLLDEQGQAAHYTVNGMQLTKVSVQLPEVFDDGLMFSETGAPALMVNGEGALLAGRTNNVTKAEPNLCRIAQTGEKHCWHNDAWVQGSDATGFWGIVPSGSGRVVQHTGPGAVGTSTGSNVIAEFSGTYGVSPIDHPLNAALVFKGKTMALLPVFQDGQIRLESWARQERHQFITASQRAIFLRESYNSSELTVLGR